MNILRFHLATPYLLAGWRGNNIFFSIFSVSCYGISPKTKFVNCLRKKTPKTREKRTYKVAQQVFHEYLLEKGIAEPTEKSEIARVLKKF